jgi:hypothetical protein
MYLQLGIEHLLITYMYNSNFTSSSIIFKMLI